MVLAVLQQHAGLRLHGHDVFASTVGGARLTDPASDLAVAVALASATFVSPPPAGVVAMGEIGLAGELRRVRDLPQRIAEAARLGFAMAVVPAEPGEQGVRSERSDQTVDGMRVVARARYRLRAPAAPPRPSDQACPRSGRRRLDSLGHRVLPGLDDRVSTGSTTARQPKGEVCRPNAATRCCACARHSPRSRPGTALRDGLERILRGRTGALIVLGHDRVVEQISTGGFELDVPFTATGLRELAKMDGGIIVDKDITRIIRAAVHLMPDHTIPSEETGTRHRTADRVARQTGFPVISVSQSMQIIAAYVGATRHVLEDSGQILSRANQALATLERYKLRLDEVSSTLSALEIEDLVTVRDVAVVAQRLEMVTRIASEIEDYVLELGTDGRLLSLQLEELVTGVDLERELVIRDYLPSSRRTKPEKLLTRLEALSATELVDPAATARVLGLGAGEHLDGAVAPRGYRLLAKVPRLPSSVVDRLVEHFGTLQKLLSAGVDDLQAVDGRRRAAGPQRARGALPAGRVDASSSVTSDAASSADLRLVLVLTGAGRRGRPAASAWARSGSAGAGSPGGWDARARTAPRPAHPRAPQRPRGRCPAAPTGSAPGSRRRSAAPSTARRRTS